MDEPVTALDYVVLVVDDVDRAVSFYTRTLGLPLKHRTDTYAQLRTGTTRLALYDRDAMSETLGFTVRRPDPNAPAFEIGFKVDDVDGAHAALVAAGADEVTPPRTRPWGQRTSYLRDPDGHLVELAQDLRPAAPVAPPPEPEALARAFTDLLDASPDDDMPDDDEPTGVFRRFRR